MKNKIIIFGDSITYGYFDENGGWAGRLKKHTIKQMIDNVEIYNRVFNYGISSNTTKEVLDNLETNTEQTMNEEGDTIIIFSVGTNDAGYYHSKKECWVPEKQFEKNIKKIINKSKKYSSKIIFLGLLPVDETRVDPLPWEKDLSYTNKLAERYDEIIKQNCKKNKIGFIDFFQNWENMDYKKLLLDGLHPNSEGHEKIYLTVKEYLEENGII